MFVAAPDCLIDEVVEEYNLDEVDRKMLKEYLEMTYEHRQVIKDYFRSVFT